jgi:hypothetical protein
MHRVMDLVSPGKRPWGRVRLLGLSTLFPQLMHRVSAFLHKPTHRFSTAIAGIGRARDPDPSRVAGAVPGISARSAASAAPLLVRWLIYWPPY